MDIQFNDKNGVKPENIKVLICSMLDIITLAGLSVDGLTNRALEQISMACLAMGGVTNLLKEIHSSHYLTSKEIIRHWNKYYSDTMNEGSYDSIRDNCVKKLVEKGIAVSQAKESSLTKNSSTAGYGLSNAFVELVNAYGTENQDSVLEKFYLYQSSIDTTEIEPSKRAEVFQKVSAKSMKKVFLLYLKRTSKQMENYNDYVESICKKIDPLLKDVGTEYSSVYQITNEDNLVTIVQSVIDKSPNLDGVLEDNWKKASSKNFKDYVLWTTLRQYRDYLVLLNASSFVFSVKQPVINKTKHHEINLKDFSPLLTALRTKPFMLLAGISGTGKSRIVRKLAQATTTQEYENEENRWKDNRPENFELIQVKPNWHNSMDVVGFYSNISKKYEFTPFVEFIVKAWQHQDTPYFLCLDEMNLAPVEEYFAEFLSAIESRSKDEKGEYVTDPVIKPFLDYDSESDDIKVSDQMIAKLIGSLDTDKKRKLAEHLRKKGLTLPPNLMVMGTVNMDETTFSFSRKVLDRAMSVEMNEVDYDKFLSGESEQFPLLTDLNELLVNRPQQASEVKDDIDSKKVIDYLKAVNDLMEGTPFKLGYRAANEAMLYVSASKDFGGTNFRIEKALDEFTLMKILSRIEGDDNRLSVDENDSRVETIGKDAIMDSGEDRINLLNCLRAIVRQHIGKDTETEKKINDMFRTLIREHFVSYWA